MLRSTSLTGGVGMGVACVAPPVGSARVVATRPAGAVPVGRGGAAPGLAGVGPSLPRTDAGVGEPSGAAGSGPDRSAAGDASTSAVAVPAGEVEAASLDALGPQPTRLTASASATTPPTPTPRRPTIRSLPDNRRVLLIPSDTRRRSPSGQRARVASAPSSKASAASRPTAERHVMRWALTGPPRAPSRRLILGIPNRHYARFGGIVPCPRQRRPHHVSGMRGAIGLAASVASGAQRARLSTAPSVYTPPAAVWAATPAV